MKEEVVCVLGDIGQVRTEITPSPSLSDCQQSSDIICSNYLQ